MILLYLQDDVATTLSIRQYLLPLQLQAESERGLAPILPGVTTSQSLGLGPRASFGPPPPPMNIGIPPPPQNFQLSHATVSSQSSWQPPVADGFASSSAPAAPSGPSSSSQSIQPPPTFNQYSAFNGGPSRQSIGGRYVAFGGAPSSVPVFVNFQAPAVAQELQAHVPAVPVTYNQISSPLSEGELEEVSLSANSSSVM